MVTSSVEGNWIGKKNQEEKKSREDEDEEKRKEEWRSDIIGLECTSDNAHFNNSMEWSPVCKAAPPSSILHLWKPILHPQPEGTTCRSDKGPR
jgi:hypothetical protein